MSSFCAKVKQDVLKFNFEIFPSWKGQRMVQMQWEPPFTSDSIELVCLVFNHEKYHFLLELLSHLKIF